MIETQETWLQSLDWEDPPGEKKTATHSSNLGWEITWTVVWQLQFMGSQRVEHS